MLYAVKYTNNVPTGFAGATTFWFIKIRPEYKDDIGLLEHEKVHVKQFWNKPILHGLLYRFSKVYRLKCEVEAYKKQLTCPPANNQNSYLVEFAKRISTMYDIETTESQIEELLK